MIGPVELAFILLFSVLWASWILALVDAIRRPAAQWRWTGRPKAVWVVLLAVFGGPASIAYWVWAFPSLRNVERRAVTGREAGIG